MYSSPYLGSATAKLESQRVATVGVLVLSSDECNARQRVVVVMPALSMPLFAVFWAHVLLF